MVAPPVKARRGFLIALEGVDGSGKTTQARLLAAALEERGLEVVLTREPTTGPLGQQLRQYFQGPERYLTPKEELNLFMADRRDHVEQVIKPALAAGKLVITDRYYYSTVAYQGALGLDPARILAQNEVLAPRPDLVFILALPTSEALARLASKRGEPTQLSESLDYLEWVAAIYDTLRGDHLKRLQALGAPQELQALLLKITIKALEDSHFSERGAK
jgi:dTMP kinase